MLCYLLLLLLSPALGQHGEEAAVSEVELASTSNERLSCSNVTNIVHAIDEALEAQKIYNSTIILNCCIESPERVLMDAVVSVFMSPTDDGQRFEMHLVNNIDILLPIEGVVGLRESWNSSVGCFSCSLNATTSEEMCSACAPYCKSCTGPANTMDDCQLCRFGRDEENADTAYCLSICNNNFDMNSIPPCSQCHAGDLLAVQNDSVSERESESRYPFQSYELRCVRSCQPQHVGRRYYEETDVEGSSTKFCFFGGIPYCDRGSPNNHDTCVECHNGTMKFEPIISMHLFEELKEEVEPAFPNNADLEHLLEELEEKCVGPTIRCVTPEMRLECFEMSLALQSTQLEVEIEHEEAARESKDLALAISLPVVCALVIGVFVGMSIFAHLRYPHVHEDKRRRTEPAPPIAATNTVWRPRSTVYLK